MTTWAAPGRVNLVGEHTDYNDGLVLPFALPFTTRARVTVRPDSDLVTIRSDKFEKTEQFPVRVRPGEVTGWASYVAGVLWALRPEGATGLDIALRSDVPLGAGLSSSAALECAVAAAVNEVWRLRLDRDELARRCRRAENDFVGVPTGPMDQLASMHCRSGHALLIDCRDLGTTDVPLELDRFGLRLLVIDTGAQHSLATTEYAVRRDQCEAAAEALAVPSLRDATLDGVRRMADPTLQRRAHHVVAENARVQDVVHLLEAGHPQDIGAFLTASHESLRDDYEVSCRELDVTVDAAVMAGALGARMTGGGFGGCAISLCRTDDVGRVIEQVEGGYAANGWQPPTWWVAEPSRGVHRLD